MIAVGSAAGASAAPFVLARSEAGGYYFYTDVTCGSACTVDEEPINRVQVGNGSVGLVVSKGRSSASVNYRHGELESIKLGISGQVDSARLEGNIIERTHVWSQATVSDYVTFRSILPWWFKWEVNLSGHVSGQAKYYLAACSGLFIDDTDYCKPEIYPNYAGAVSGATLFPGYIVPTEQTIQFNFVLRGEAGQSSPGMYDAAQSAYISLWVPPDVEILGTGSGQIAIRRLGSDIIEVPSIYDPDALTSVPEPSTLSLIVSASAALALRRLRGVRVRRRESGRRGPSLVALRCGPAATPQ